MISPRLSAVQVHPAGSLASLASASASTVGEILAARFDRPVEFRQLLPEPARSMCAALLRRWRSVARAGARAPLRGRELHRQRRRPRDVPGRSGALGDPADRFLFHGLREQADAVLAGTRTLKIERYGRIMRDAEARRRREQAGRSPGAARVRRHPQRRRSRPTSRCSPSPRRGSCSSPRCRSTSSGCAGSRRAGRELDPGELTLTTVLRRLRSRLRVASLLCEGGPTVFGVAARRAPRRRAVPDARAEAGRRRIRADDHERARARRARADAGRVGARARRALYLRYRLALMTRRSQDSSFAEGAGMRTMERCRARAAVGAAGPSASSGSRSLEALERGARADAGARRSRSPTKTWSASTRR